MGFVLFIEEVLRLNLYKEVRKCYQFVELETKTLFYYQKEDTMNILDIIAKKRDGKELSKEEIIFFIDGYVKGTIVDYQASAFIMALYIQGMTKQETTELTLAMAHSGDSLDLSLLGKTIVDKHSTGGVGDKVSLILLPLVASLGVPVAKMSGRGLGFTGGTVDKLESIPGYKTEIDISQFIQQVEEIGISMISQTMNLAPADKKIYALRDSIACVESIPLIASSIMSKKIASGAQKIVLDVTVGKGAFMKNVEDARRLADEMTQIGKLAGRETVCLLTQMEEPLGYAVGNILEVKEAVRFLQGDMPEDLKQVVLELGSYMMRLAGKGESLEENKRDMLEAIHSGVAYQKFLALVKAQGGDTSYLEKLEKFPEAKWILEVRSKHAGYIHEINAEEIGKLCSYLGAGRMKKEDKIDFSVGVILQQKVGDKVEVGDILGVIHANSEEKMKAATEMLGSIYQIRKQEILPLPSILSL